MTKRKVFIKTDLSIPRVEHFRSPSGIIVVPSGEIPPANTVVTFSTIGIGTDRFDFREWYGTRIDQVVYACHMQIARFLDDQDSEVTEATVQTYCVRGLRTFFRYLTFLTVATDRDLALADINRQVIDGYLEFLRDAGTETSTQKSTYNALKAVLRALCNRGLIHEIHAGDNATFPRNPFPGVHNNHKTARPLSKADRTAFSRAVKEAVMPIFSNDIEPTSELLAYALLIIALHTGRNTWPLLEMKPDCLRSHPKADTLFLVLYKRRGHSTSKAAIKTEHQVVESLPTVRPTVAALVRRVIELSDRLRNEAPEGFEDRVWLYRMRTGSRGVGHAGAVSVLTEETLSRAVRLLVKRFNLLDADGKPMRINVSRLRKTFVNRIYEILDGDVASTAIAAGDTVNVTMANYLQPGEDSQRNWKFMGSALVQELLTNTLGATERTPVGRCSDNKHGDYAPKKNGSVCMSFLNCLRCRNYVVTGDDLYRLFSFYWRVLRERARIAPERWRRQFAHIVRLIERDVVAIGLARGVFVESIVDRERERARVDPHPFWRGDTIIADLAGTS
ncbi:phage integrase SAM-like domain-containing protein [Hydrogenophaga intermedia]|uniref:Uncharacterized protein n=1 Tax=Hydrogenophaga intermedia TaxID=65786 RepID=A0A1L1PSQ3_HYDIT|nr:phage integrase SAM-like domain-containing protein [Hydrogenophaga intermedia]CDN87621.1 hypothetical protein BN948_02046 [Hydrogenophaga intermedia]